MSFKKITFLLCLSTVLGLSACGEKKAEPAAGTAVGLMSENNAAGNIADAQPVKKSRSKKASTTDAASPKIIVNINTATAEELVAALKGTGVGEAKVQNIIAYRQQHGGFKSVDELKEVKGIGEKTVEKLRDRVTLSGASSTPPSEKEEQSKK